MKKIIIALSIVMVLIYPLQLQHQQTAEAAIASKVASAAAKKVAKVPIKELTKDIAFDLAAQAIGQQFNEKLTFKFEEGYEGYCMTEIKSDGSCGRVVQVKKDLTVEEINRIDNQVETEMDKAITGGKGFPKWQKFLDWFVPIWLISAGVTAITYAFDSDVRSLFNEIGYNTLVSLGFIKPVLTDKTNDLEGREVGFDPVDFPEEQVEITGKIAKTVSNYGAPAQIMVPLDNFSLQHKEQMTIHTYSNSANMTPYVLNNVEFRINEQVAVIIQPAYNSITLMTDKFSGFHDAVVIQNSEQYDYKNLTNGQVQFKYGTMENTKKISMRIPYYDSSSKLYVMNIYTDKSRIQLRFADYTFKPSTINSVRTAITTENGDWTIQKATIAVNGTVPLYETTHIPTFEEIETVVPASTSKFEEGGNIALVPPSAVPIREVGTGETVVRTPAKTPNEEPIYTKPDGTVVPPENVQVGDPIVTPAKPGQLDPGGKPIPEGTPTVTPTPTPTNPNPTPAPLTPTPTPTNPADPDAPPQGPAPPPVETTPPYFPEGENCSEGLKIPRFLPLLNTISETFPFSIPFDLYGGFEALFINMGNEKPEFDFKFDVLGKEQSWHIALPPMFDEWKKFTDSLLIFIFDIGIIWAIFRFTGGGK